jgi:hypothetical protein
VIRELILRWARNREPDFIIGGKERPYLRRHWLLPRNPVFNVYVHEFLRSDDDRALHDHPWIFNASWLIDGAYIEWQPGNGNPLRPVARFLKAGDFKFRRGRAPHRVQLHRVGGPEVPCWTVFFTGPRVREWGFYCDKGWIHWKRFTAADDPGAVGRGCEA